MVRKIRTQSLILFQAYFPQKGTLEMGRVRRGFRERSYRGKRKKADKEGRLRGTGRWRKLPKSVFRVPQPLNAACLLSWGMRKVKPKKKKSS